MIIFATPIIKFDTRRIILAVSCLWMLDVLQTGYPGAVEGRTKPLLHVDTCYYGAHFKQRVL